MLKSDNNKLKKIGKENFKFQYRKTKTKTKYLMYFFFVIYTRFKFLNNLLLLLCNTFIKL